MRYIVNLGFSIVTTVLYVACAMVILHGAWSKPEYSPGDALTLFGLTSGAITAFLVAQLGLATANSETGTRESLQAAMAGEQKPGADAVIACTAAVFVLVGLAFVWSWISPGQIAVPKGKPDLRSAPDYITVQAKVFVGIVIAGFAALSAALRA